jgi:hypothetical protein
MNNKWVWTLVATVFWTVSVGAQWTARGDVAAGFGETLIVAVGCSGTNPVATIRFVDDGNFASGVVIAAFDNRDPLDLEFANRGQQLNAVVANGPGRDFVQLLIRSGQLTVGVGRRGRSAPVVETISLRGSGAAIRSLACIRR